MRLHEIADPPRPDPKPHRRTIHGGGQYLLSYNGVLRRRTNNPRIAKMFALKGWKIHVEIAGQIHPLDPQELPRLGKPWND